MNLYFAPLEGITAYIYRNIHAQMFGFCDAYFAPFITPSDNERVSIKSLRDLLPERNKDVRLVPQVLTSRSEAFLSFAERLSEIGYSEVNLNLGCPSSTVVKKGRGAGFLKNPEELDRFFYEITCKSDFKFSVKTRIGFSSGEEMERLVQIYNKYPLKELIIHPRTREQYYKDEPDIKVFNEAYGASVNKICYNGDIYSKKDYGEICSLFPNLSGIMIGRGAIKNPAIFREIKGGCALKTEELINFSERLTEAYREILGSEKYTIHKLKEIWLYMLLNFPKEKKVQKAVKKANKLSELSSAVKYLPEIKK